LRQVVLSFVNSLECQYAWWKGQKVWSSSLKSTYLSQVWKGEKNPFDRCMDRIKKKINSLVLKIYEQVETLQIRCLSYWFLKAPEYE